MARPGLTRHRKFLALCRMLGIRKAQAIGHLELLWMSAYESGDPLLGTPEDVEDSADWLHDDGREPARRGEFFQAAMTCGGPGRAGFIEEVPDTPGMYQVHDLFDHAPDYVAKRAEREAERKAKGKTLSQIRSEAGKRGAERRWHDSERVANTQLNGKRVANAEAGHTLPMANDGTPAPAPTEDQDSGGSTHRRQADGSSNGYCAAFLEWWEAYPRKQGKQAAFAAWKKAGARVRVDQGIDSPAAAGYLLERAAAYADAKRGSDVQFIPHPATWLNKGRYDDDPATWEREKSVGDGRARNQGTLERVLDFYAEENQDGN